jgi:hypothetical protein
MQLEIHITDPSTVPLDAACFALILNNTYIILEIIKLSVTKYSKHYGHSFSGQDVLLCTA